MSTTVASRSAPIVLSRAAVAGIAATFCVMGSLVATYGPLLEHLTRRFGVSLPEAGSVLSVHYLGGLVGVVVAMFTLQRRQARATVVPALGLTAAGCVTVALAPAWPVLVAGVFVVGTGFGALVIALNQLVAYSAGRRRTALLNGLNAGYSAGAVVGPVLVAALAQSHFATMYAAFAVVAVAVIPLTGGVAGSLPSAVGASGRPAPIVAVFIVAFVMYVGIEVGTGGWMASHLESSGIGSTTAAALTSGFWLAFFAGRVLVSLLPGDLPEGRVVISAAALATVFLIATAIQPVAPAAYLLAGIAMSPIYPTAIVWLAKLRPDDARATAWLFPATAVGGVAGPAAIGIVVRAFGVAWTPAVLVGVGLVMTLSFLLARYVATRRLA